jgi:putative DNA primase/helicase
MPHESPDDATQLITLTRLTSTDDSDLAKAFRLDADGAIRKTSHAQFGRGVARTETLAGGLSDLPKLLDDLEPVECIATGVFDASPARVTPRGAADDGSSAHPIRHRTKEAMHQPSPGLLLFDHDPSPRMPEAIRCTTPAALMTLLGAALPDLEDVGWVGRGSSSSGIANAQTGEPYEGSAGLHVYTASAITNLEGLRTYLSAKLWVAGLGYVDLASNGRRLLRTPIDLTVLSPERLIFEAPPRIGPGLRRTAPSWDQQEGTLLSIEDLTLSAQDRQEAEARQQAALEEPELLEAAEMQYERYRDDLATRTAKLQGVSKATALERLPRYKDAMVDKQTVLLPPEHPMQIGGQWLTARELWENAADFDGQSLPDPVEGPDYGTTTAKFYANEDKNSEPVIHSWAHGASTCYQLAPEPTVAPLDADPATSGTSAPPPGMPVSSCDSTDLSKPLPMDSFPHLQGSGEARKPKSTIENFRHLIDSYDVSLRYDVIKKMLQVRVPGMTGAVDNQLTSAVARIESLAILNGLSTTNCGKYLNLLADERQVNPIADWITVKPWDGQDRLSPFYDTLTEREGYPVALKRALMYRWLLSAVAAALTASGFHNRGVLTLQGPQGIGKTTWLLNLVNDPYLRENYVLAGHHLDPSLKDTILLAIQHWIVELGELDSSFKKDVARIKGVITNKADKVRRPYAPAASEYQRRTVFAASVNEEHFLVDPTGNSRWWVIPVTAIDYQHAINMQQLFAQLKVDFDAGEQWWLTREEDDLLHEQNKTHNAVNVIEEALLEALDDTLPEDDWPALTATQVLQRLGYARPSNAQARDCGQVLRLHFGDPKKIRGIQKWRLPLSDRL